MLTVSLTAQKKERYNDIFSLLRAVCMHSTGTEKLKEETSNLLNAFLNVNSNLTIENLRGLL